MSGRVLRTGLTALGLTTLGLSIGLSVGLCGGAMAEDNRLAMAKPSGVTVTPAVKSYGGKLHIVRGVTAPRLRMAPTAPVAPVKPVRLKPARR